MPWSGSLSTPWPRQQLERAVDASGGHTADTVYGGREKVLRQTVIGMIEGATPAEQGARLLRPDRTNEPARFGKLARYRQWIEAVFDTLKGQLTLEAHGGRTLVGVYARVGARLLAMAAAIWHNWRTGAAVKRSLAYDH